MEQYPNADEEFDMRYGEEMEMIGALPLVEEGNSLYMPATQSEFDTGEKLKTALPSTVQEAEDVLTFQSPQLSQISCGIHAGPVNRRLFGTPLGPQRGSSTPLTGKLRMPVIHEVEASNVAPDSAPVSAAVDVQNVELCRKRRLDKDLFGDFDHINSYVDPIAKRIRSEEERDFKIIAQILETRSKLRESGNSLKHSDLSRLDKIHAFKKRNLSYSVPQWPFLPLVRSDGERVYVRYHSEDYENHAIENTIVHTKGYGCMLGDRKQQTWDGANEIILKKTAVTTPHTSAANSGSERVEPLGESLLWVEKYKPKKYMDLLSDETTNRTLLYWLKMWDKVVFGKNFVKKERTAKTDMNSFNKKTGRFEFRSGWQQKKRDNLNTCVDALGRPVQKVALLCGPPGLGKTTLSHTIARHAGYRVREINASDDRSPNAFKLALEDGTQMTSILNVEKRPNCIVLDEIDGAPKQSIEFLIKFVTDNVLTKVKAKGAKSQRNILKRPIICICNDAYEPALRQLRQMAFVITFASIESEHLAERLEEIARKENLKTDFGALLALAEKSGNDVRSCISTMQFFSAQKKTMTLHDVLNSNLGLKDRHQGLFDIWGAIFRIQRPKKRIESGASEEESQITLTNMSVEERVRNVLDVVHAGGDYERLTEGIFENYLHQKMPDSNLNGIVSATQWFCFSDRIHNHIYQFRDYSVYSYLQYPFVVWHLLFASRAWPKITFPTRGFQFQQKSGISSNIFQAFRKGISTGAVGVGQGSVVLLETIPLLKHILSPQLRSVALELLSSRERCDLRHTVQIMSDFGLTYIQAKTADGHFVFQMEPDLDALSQFSGFSRISLNYFGRQLISREVELEQIRRSMPKSATTTNTPPGEKASHNTSEDKKLPNNFQSLKGLQAKEDIIANKPAVSKDFFGRIQEKQSSAGRTVPDPIIKSLIWYRYKEGFNNAVRKDIHMNELL